MSAESRQEELVRVLTDRAETVAVSDLASQFAVTIRTVLRDVDALRERGYEIEGTRGRGGGLKLIPGSPTLPEPIVFPTDEPEVANRSARERAPVFVGRQQELDALVDAFHETRSGSGTIVMLAGEPGIGKTGVVQRVSHRLQAGGAQLYWGRCYESEGALPYWPWVQVINAYASATPIGELREELGDGAAEIAELVPELRTYLPDLDRPSQAETPEVARFRLFRSVTRFLSRASAKSPMTLILEDLHWADRPSLLLLEFIAQELIGLPALLIGTYRDVELHRRHPLGQTLAELNRQQNFRRITLRGLEPEDVGRMVAMASSREPSAELVETLHRQTEGNPLFVTEMVNLLLDEGLLLDGTTDMNSLLLGRVPEGVREAIGRRLDRLSDPANTVLRAASVMGREFTVHEARRLGSGLANLTPGRASVPAFGQDADVLFVLEEALRAGIVERVAGELASYQFTHSMIRDTLYEELTAFERVTLHRLAGETIEQLHGADIDAHLSQLAHHFLEASQGGDPEKAVQYGERAGNRAAEMIASEEATRLYGMALQALQLSESPDDRKRCELMNALGRSQMLAGAILESRETHAATAEIAKRIGAVELQAEAAIAFETAGWYPGYDGTPAVKLLSEALELLGEDDSEVRALALGSLGRAYSYSGDLESAIVTGRQAIEMARRVGTPATLAAALWSRLPARLDPSDIHERVDIAWEAMGICEELGRFDMSVEAEAWLLNDLLELGDTAHIGPVFESWRMKINSLQVPMWRFNLLNVEIGNAFRFGQFGEAERLVDLLSEYGEGLIGLDVAGVHGATMFALRREQGRLDEVKPALELFLKLHPSGGWQPGLAILYAELDMREEAQREFDSLAADDFASIKRDGLFTTTVAAMSDVCCYLDDRDRAEILYRLLTPHQDRNITLGVGHVYQGPVARYMGTLATTMGQWSLADRHFEFAVEMATKMSSPPQVAHAKLSYARMLALRNSSGDAVRIRTILDDSAEIASELGMDSLTRQIERELNSTPARQRHPAGLSDREVDVLRLLAMGRSNQEIGGELYITANTVANHVKNILGKTGASNRTEAAAYAVRSSLV